MSRLKAALALFGLSAAIVLVVACNNDNDTPAVEASVTTAPVSAEEVAAALEPEVMKALLAATTIVSSETQVAIPVPPPAVQEVSAPPAPVVKGRLVSEATASGQASVVAQVGGTGAGIHVSGEGSITMAPDLAMLNIGVEATAATVSDARQQAATAMNAIVDALHDNGVEDKDIQTRFFNISPRYDFQEVLREGGLKSRKQVLVGYMISNSASIKIRDLDAVGTVVDDVAEAGGDATRINGISFTVEDPSPFMVQLREEAVEDALAKASQFADLTGVSLGRLVLISEIGRGAPVINTFGDRAMFAQAESAPTQISGGELELRMSVQAVFDIL